MIINIIAALTAEDGGIGKDNKLPWNIPQDLARFSALTRDCIVVMGYNTYKSIPYYKFPLVNRYNIVITSKWKNLQSSNIYDDLVFCPIQDVENVFENLKDRYAACYVIGGAKIYQQFLDKANMLFLTKIQKKYSCDTFFPSYQDDYVLFEECEEIWSEEEKCYYKFEQWKKSHKICINTSIK